MSLSTSPVSALALLTLTFFSCMPRVAGNTYTLVDDYLQSPSTLINDFTFFTGPDPTDGLVNYVDSATAISTALIGIVAGNSSSPFTSGSQALYIGVDTSSVTPAGRPSVRISSKKIYQPGMLLVADIAHMPAGCGTWPALWMLGAGTWPDSGEIDIVERVEGQMANSMTLHTSAACSMPNASATFSGAMLTDNCDVAANGNAGCQIMGEAGGAGASSAGAPFNAQGGGVFVTEWTASVINVWFFAATAALPASLASNALTASTAGLGVPAASFPATPTCDFASHFRDMQILLDTTFCGAWAGAVWQSGGCAAQTGVATCNDYVANHPEAFTEAYWSIRALSVYEAV